MSDVQPGILAPIPRVARYLTFSHGNVEQAGTVLAEFARSVDGDRSVVGLGLSLIAGLGRHIEGLSVFPSRVGKAIEVPSTPSALWCWLRGEDPGELLHRTRALAGQLAPAFTLETVVDAFRYGSGLDLTGYEDGTENPEGDEADRVAVSRDSATGLDGSSFVAVQQWVHDLDRFQSLPARSQDCIIGRRRSDNTELDDAPRSAHVKRTAQESFDPNAYIVRRSMPWADRDRAGLVFVAFGRSFDAFEAILNRMVGAEDGITDALFTFTRPITGGYFWCPPVRAGRLDLRAIGL